MAPAAATAPEPRRKSRRVKPEGGLFCVRSMVCSLIRATSAGGRVKYRAPTGSQAGDYTPGKVPSNQGDENLGVAKEPPYPPRFCAMRRRDSKTLLSRDQFRASSRVIRPPAVR